MALPRCPFVLIDHRTLKTPTHHDKERNWVVSIDHDGMQLVLKIFAPGDPLFPQERAALQEAAALADEDVVPDLVVLPETSFLAPYTRQRCLILSSLPGRTLADAGLSTDDIVAALIKAADRIWRPQASRRVTAAFLMPTQGQLCWCAAPPALPVLTIRDHLLEALLLTRAQAVFPTGQLADRLIEQARHLTWVDRLPFGLNHNDLHVYNVLLYWRRIAIVDLASACIGSRLVDLGGILAHVGLDAFDTILDASVHRLAAVRDDAEENRDAIRAGLAFFCLKRSLRRLAYLSRLDLAPGDPALERPVTTIDTLLAGMSGGRS